MPHTTVVTLVMNLEHLHFTIDWIEYRDSPSNWPVTPLKAIEMVCVGCASSNSSLVSLLMEMEDDAMTFGFEIMCEALMLRTTGEHATGQEYNYAVPRCWTTSVLPTQSHGLSPRLRLCSFLSRAKALTEPSPWPGSARPTGAQLGSAPGLELGLAQH
jgi:hypothetical protein